MFDMCFYHSADFDGQCSAAIVKMFFPDVELFGINYGEEFPWEDVVGRRVVMVDFSLSFEDMLKLDEKAETFVWVDHHKSAIEQCENAGVVFMGCQSVEYAACELTWRVCCQLVQDEIRYPNLAKMSKPLYWLGRYDNWDCVEGNPFVMKDPLTMPFQYGLRFEKDTEPENQALWARLLGNPVTGEEVDEEFVRKILTNGKLLYENERRSNALMVGDKSFEAEIGGLCVIALNTHLKGSILFESV